MNIGWLIRNTIDILNMNESLNSSTMIRGELSKV